MPVTYKCPGCGAPMEYDAASGTLKCGHCGYQMSINDVGKIKPEKDESYSQNYDTSKDKSEFRVYHCSACGAEVLTDANTTASICSFCGSPNLLSDRIEETCPTQVIPFKVTKDQAKEKFRAWTRTGWLTPRVFRSSATMDKLTGIYVPYWLYDYDVDVAMSAHCTRVRRQRRGNTEYIYTDHFQVERDLTVDYDKIPADASERMEDELMDTVEPFDYSCLTTFEMPYLSGYFSEKYNYTSDQLSERARNKVRGFAENEARSTIVGYTTTTILNEHMNFHELNSEYVLLPVWMLNYRYKDKNYQFAVNGQTGKIVGKLPVSYGRAAGTFAGLTAIIFAALSIVGVLL